VDDKQGLERHCSSNQPAAHLQFHAKDLKFRKDSGNPAVRPAV